MICYVVNCEMNEMITKHISQYLTVNITVNKIYIKNTVDNYRLK